MRVCGQHFPAAVPRGRGGRYEGGREYEQGSAYLLILAALVRNDQHEPGRSTFATDGTNKRSPAGAGEGMPERVFGRPPSGVAVGG